ncbi:MAG: hypothetical protein H6Q70_104 [Firmicutes bacterium]|nr:hypothetical protein [Bacillota bacterium]
MIAWPLSTLPTDTELDKWLECNGQAVNATLYPKLAVLMSNTPNYQGVFLRGYGSQYSYHYNTVLHSSSSLGILQGDSIRNITGRLQDRDSMEMLQGAFYFDSSTPHGNGGTVSKGSYEIIFDTSRVVPASNENRPVNIAVKYLIKAK